MTLPPSPLQTVHVVQRINANTTDTHRVPVPAEPTGNEHLAIALGLLDGHFTGVYTLTHVPTGLALTHSTRPDQLRHLAATLAHLPWADVTPENFPGSETQAEAAKVLREARFTDPTAVELPAHDAFGTDGKGNGLQRAAVPMAKGILADFQKAVEKTSGDNAVDLDVPDATNPRGSRPNPEWTFWIMRMVHDFGLAYLLLAMHRLDPQAADSAAAFLADCWDAGDSTGEWAWEWHQALLKGQTPELPGIPDPTSEILTAGAL